MPIDEKNYDVKENIRVSRVLLFAEWPEKSEAGISAASGTGSVRVIAQGLVSILQ